VAEGAAGEEGAAECEADAEAAKCAQAETEAAGADEARAVFLPHSCTCPLSDVLNLVLVGVLHT
jgi:hypothetical protein